MPKHPPMRSVFLVFPHQLFEDIGALKKVDHVYLVEEYLFFNQYKFHQQKLVFHRASMKYYQNYLQNNGIQVTYIEARHPHHHIQQLIHYLSEQKVEVIHYYEVTDNWLQKNISEACSRYQMASIQHDSLAFLNSTAALQDYFSQNRTYLHNDFYIQQRKKWQILIDAQQKPVGGKWSYDADNRLKYPKNKTAPTVPTINIHAFYEEAINYVQQHYSQNYGTINTAFLLPVTHAESMAWLEHFLANRLEEFGAYEDAIVDDAEILHHSVLSPLLNVGLLTPQKVIETTLAYAATHVIPLNSLEGFIRQIVGWREFIRGIYLHKGTLQRNRNFWQFHQPIPASFYTGNTGLIPVDVTIKKILSTGYCHHIERLMILGNCMLLSQFHPDSVYQWFMELFMDAYDWVMVPNVYGMSQFADGGLMATKPYISGSNYILKMSNYQKGPWANTWDALFWCFLAQHRSFFAKQPRLNMLLGTLDKMPKEKREKMNALAAAWQNQ